jgi:hypothetical protein
MFIFLIKNRPFLLSSGRALPSVTVIDAGPWPRRRCPGRGGGRLSTSGARGAQRGRARCQTAADAADVGAPRHPPWGPCCASDGWRSTLSSFLRSSEAHHRMSSESLGFENKRLKRSIGDRYHKTNAWILLWLVSSTAKVLFFSSTF